MSKPDTSIAISGVTASNCPPRVHRYSRRKSLSLLVSTKYSPSAGPYAIRYSTCSSCPRSGVTARVATSNSTYSREAAPVALLSSSVNPPACSRWSATLHRPG